MKTNGVRPEVVFIIVLSIALSACGGHAYQNAYVSPKYTPDAERKGPLGELAPLAISIQVDDQRTGESHRVGNKRHAFNAVAAKVLSDTGPATIIYNALKAECESSGHRIVEAKASEADAVINVDLKKFWSDNHVRFADMELVADLETNVAILNVLNQTELVSKPLNGSYRENFFAPFDANYETVFKGALSDYVQRFSHDPDFLAALTSVASNKEKR